MMLDGVPDRQPVRKVGLPHRDNVPSPSCDFRKVLAG